MSGEYTLFTISILMLAISSILLLVSVYSLVWVRRQGRVQRHQLDNLRNDFRAITAAAKGVGKRVLQMERRQRNLAQRQDQVVLYDAANQPYEQAIRLAQRGMEKDELVEVCGLSEGEADLINMLHRLDKVS